MSEDPRGASPLVFIADDDPEVRELVVDVLAQAGFRTLTAADGEEAVALVLDRSPDLVVLDVMMPRMDGYTALTRLRGHPATREVPVVILTGQGDPIYRSLSAGVGAVAHLAKPFTPSELVETARRILAERASRLGEERGLGAHLVERGFITADQLEEARQVQRQDSTRRLGQILLELVAVSPDQLNRARAEVLGIPHVEFRESAADLELVRSLPEEALRRHRAVPVRRDGDELAVVLVDPTNRQAIAELEALTGARVVRPSRSGRRSSACSTRPTLPPRSGRGRRPRCHRGARHPGRGRRQRCGSGLRPPPRRPS